MAIMSDDSESEEEMDEQSQVRHIFTTLAVPVFSVWSKVRRSKFYHVDLSERVILTQFVLSGLC